MATVRRPSGAALQVFAVVSGVVCLLLVVVVIAFGVGAGSILSLMGLPVEHRQVDEQAEEFAASSPNCVELSETQALFAVTIEPINTSRVMSVSVEELGIRGGELTGVATLPQGTSLDSISDVERLAMEADLDDAQMTVETSHEVRVVVMRIERAPGFDATITDVTLWFSYGETAGVQHLPMSLSWGEDCVLAGESTTPRADSRRVARFDL
jgi:hypothetical protein